MRKDGEEGWRKEGDGIDGDVLDVLDVLDGDTPLRSRMKRNIHCCYGYNVSKKLFRSVFVKVESKNELDFMSSLPE